MPRTEQKCKENVSAERKQQTKNVSRAIFRHTKRPITLVQSVAISVVQPHRRQSRPFKTSDQSKSQFLFSSTKSIQHRHTWKSAVFSTLVREAVLRRFVCVPTGRAPHGHGGSAARGDRTGYPGQPEERPAASTWGSNLGKPRAAPEKPPVTPAGIPDESNHKPEMNERAFKI